MPSPLQLWYGIHKSFLFPFAIYLTNRSNLRISSGNQVNACDSSSWGMWCFFKIKASTESPHIPAYQTYPILDTCIQQGNPLMIFTHTSHVPMTCVSSWAKKDKERFTTHHFITSDHETLVGAWTIQSNLEIFGFVPTLAFLVYCQLLGWIHQQLHLFPDTEICVWRKRMAVIGRDSHPN